MKYVVSVKRFTKITKSKYPFQRFPYNFAMNIKHKGGRDFNRMTEMVLVTLMARENGKKHLVAIFTGESVVTIPPPIGELISTI